MENVRSALLEAVATSPTPSRATTPVHQTTTEVLCNSASVRVQETHDISTAMTEDGIATLSDEHLTPSATTQSIVDKPSGTILSQPVIVAVVLSENVLAHSSPPHNYAPPETEGVDYRPHNLPSPADVKRGTQGRFPWYVAKKSKVPGIYASWYAYLTDKLLFMSRELNMSRQGGSLQVKPRVLEEYG